MTAPTELARRLRARIDAEGPLPFSAYMAACLYDPEHGYYARPGFTTGRTGDFATAPDAGPLLGATLARAVSAFAEVGAGRLVELGPGSGRLAQDLWGVLPEAAREALELVLVEPFEARHPGLAQALPEARVVAELAGIGPGRTFLYANEVLDALPLEVVRRTGAGFEQLLVDLGPGGFEETWRPATGEVAAFAREHASALPEGHRYEACLAARGLLDELAATLSPGVALLLDYGGPFETIWPQRPDGTLRGFRGHRHAAPLAAPGETDLTADVDLDMVAREAAARGLSTAARGEQERLLVHLGLVEVAEAQGALSAVKQLLVPGAFAGRFHALVLDQGGVAGETHLAVDLDDPRIWERGVR